MSLISSTIPSLLNGVSQQPPLLRLPSQSEAQVNTLPSAVEGLRKRPGTRYEYVAWEGVAESRSLLSHTINRDVAERYQLLISGSSVRVRELVSGENVPVTFSSGTRDYLSCSEPDEDLRAVTVADYTFILNRTKVVRSLADTIPEYNPQALIWVRQGAFGSAYSVTLAGQTVTYGTPTRAATDAEWTAGKRWLEVGSGGGETTTTTIPSTYDAAPPRQLPQYTTQAQVGTERIAKGVFDLLRFNPAFFGKFSFTLNGSLVLVNSLNGDDFSLSTSDSQGDTILKSIKDRVQTFSDLPKFCFNNFRVKVMGDDATEFDDYFVKYEGTKTGGVWVEDIADSERYKLDPTTMPHALIRKADGSFSFEALPWEPRKAGDEDSNPMPSIVGKRVRDLFFHRDRLGMVAQENVVMSRYGDYFNLFRASATQTLDTDPIDVAVSHTKVADINHAVSYNGTLMLIASGVQFQLAPVDLLTPKTVAFNQTTEFVVDPVCRPVGAGSNMYFSTPRGGFAAVHEFYVDADTTSKDAVDVTANVPRYVPSQLTQLVICQPENLLVALSKKKQHSLYVYNYLWQGQEKVQSGWHRWDFPTDIEILSVSCIDSKLWLTIRRGTSIIMESMDLAPGVVATGLSFPVFLDRMATHTEAEVEISYNAGRNITTLKLPFPVYSDTTLIAQDGNPETAFYTDGRNSFLRFFEGELVEFTHTVINGVTTVYVRGNLEKFWIGRKFTMQYTLSPFFIRKDGGGGQGVSVTEGRLQLRKLAIDYVNSGFIKVRVQATGRSTQEYVMTAKRLGSNTLKINRINVEDGTMRVPLLARNTEVTVTIENDSILPSTILAVTWEGMYHSKIRGSI